MVVQTLIHRGAFDHPADKDVSGVGNLGFGIQNGINIPIRQLFCLVPLAMAMVEAIMYAPSLGIVHSTGTPCRMIWAQWSVLSEVTHTSPRAKSC